MLLLYSFSSLMPLHISTALGSCIDHELDKTIILSLLPLHISTALGSCIYHELDKTIILTLLPLHISTALGSCIDHELDKTIKLTLLPLHISTALGSCIDHVLDKTIILSLLTFHISTVCTLIWSTFQTGILKLGDFGISKMLTSDSAAADSVVGTPYYMSPEICRLYSYLFLHNIFYSTILILLITLFSA